MGRMFRSFHRWYRSKLIAERVEILRREIHETRPETVLEVGAGDGTILKALSDSCNGVKSFRGIDLPSAYSVRRMPDMVDAMDVTRLDYPRDSFDFVYSLHTLEHIQNIGKALNEIVRVLRPGGGRLLIMSPWELWRGSNALLDSFIMTHNLMKSFQLSRTLHRHSLRSAGFQSQTSGSLRRVKKSVVVSRLFSPEVLFLFEK